MTSPALGMWVMQRKASARCAVSCPGHPSHAGRSRPAGSPIDDGQVELRMPVGEGGVGLDAGDDLDREVRLAGGGAGRPRWTPQIRPSNDTSKPATTGIRLGRVEDLRRRPVRPQVRLNLGAPAPGPTFEDVGMMEQAVQYRGDRGRVPEQLAPILDRPIGRQERRGPLVPPHDDFQEVLGRRMWQLPHPEIVDNEQRDRGELGEVAPTGAVERGGGQFLEERVRFAIDDSMALLDRGPPEGLGQDASMSVKRAPHWPPGVGTGDGRGSASGSV